MPRGRPPKWKNSLKASNTAARRWVPIGIDQRRLIRMI